MNIGTDATHDTSIDKEWVHLMMTARDIGISIDDVKVFLGSANAGKTLTQAE